MNRKEMHKIIEDLFVRAKAADEFEYACCLLRVRGMEDAGWDPLMETQALYSDILGLVQAPIQPHTRARLLLLLYCHLTEVDAIYVMLEGLISIIEGDRYSAYPFMHLYGPKGKKVAPVDKFPPSAKSVVNAIKKHAKEAGEQGIKEVLDWFFDENIRNSFFHSDYILYNNELRARNGFFEVKPKYFEQKLSFPDLEDRINRGIAFFAEFMTIYHRHRRSYKKNKVVMGRFAADGTSIPVELMADKNGLNGFRNPPR
jgi:hypothetical protein